MRETGPGKFRTKTRTWSVLPATSLSRISQESRSPPPRPRDLHFFSSLSQCKPWQGLTRWFWVRILLALYACWIWYKASGGWNGWGQPAPMSPWVEAGKAPGSSASLVSGEERLTSLSGHNILSQEYQSRDRESAFRKVSFGSSKSCPDFSQPLLFFSNYIPSGSGWLHSEQNNNSGIIQIGNFNNCLLYLYLSWVWKNEGALICILLKAIYKKIQKKRWERKLPTVAYA